MPEFAGVLLEMGAGNPNHKLVIPGIDVDNTLVTKRFVELADLVPLGEIRVEIVLAIPFRVPCN